MANAHSTNEHSNDVTVTHNNMDRAISRLRRNLAQDRWSTDIRAKEFFVSKGEAKRKADAQARRRQLKAAQEEDEDLSHDVLHHLSAMKRGRTRKQRREYDRKVQEAHSAELRGEGTAKENKKSIPFLGDYSDFTW